MVIPLTHHKKSNLAELKVVGGYLFVYRIFSRCAKGIAIFFSKNLKKNFLSCKDMTLWGVLLIENQKKDGGTPP
ncbi:MAG: hypothetical protein IJJ76_05470 [Ruminococcus sp.]|uniref:hypothetical protein n=1 Tax=Ruminococcus sp. TaxID=41978 RepID=UPI0025FAFF83|nr:hypothetical protein [Ruminococcus sp.]MBR0529200.1 hypothetical protein [Ruminococcus sp.]